MVNAASVHGATICQSAALSELLHTPEKNQIAILIWKNKNKKYREAAEDEVCVCARVFARARRLYQPKWKTSTTPTILDDLMKCIEMYSYFLFTDYYIWR